MAQSIQVDGIEVLLEGQGEQTVLMIHGWPDTRVLWDRQVEALKAQYRCARFTLPGYDMSKPARKTSLAQMTALIKTIADAVSPGKPVILLIHDWGCFFGYEFAANFPQRVQRIIALDIGDTRSGAFLKNLSGKAKAGIAAYQLWLAFCWMLRPLLPPLANGLTRWMAKQLRAPAAPEQIGAQQNYPYWLQWTGGFNAAKRFEPHCPMLFFYAEKKPFMFHSQAWLDKLSALPGCQVQAMRTGHWIMAQDSEGLNRTMLDWLWKGKHH